jgi:AbrB family looped-hinge helix DNA binding protein
MPTLRIGSKGTITLPTRLRKKYNIEEGEVLTLGDLGEGALLLRPMLSQVDKLSRQIARRLKKENVSLDDLLQALDEERKTYSKKYVTGKSSRSPTDCQFISRAVQFGSIDWAIPRLPQRT